MKRLSAQRLLLTLALTLTATAAAFAQQKGYVEFRTGDAVSGHVKSVRIETAEFSKAGGALVEGPRRLSVSVSYTPDGKRSVYEGYAPDGSLRQRYVHVYDDAGRQLEQSNYDGRGRLLSRFVYLPQTGENLTYNGDGTLRERVQTVSNDAHDRVIEVRTYDGAGALLSRRVNTREGDKSFWRTYGPDGSLVAENVFSLDYGGPHRVEEYTYNADGSVAGRRASTGDASSSNLKAVVENPDGTPRQKTRETREYDSHRNLLKLTNYVWDEGARDYVPSAVSYYTIVYYD